MPILDQFETEPKYSFSGSMDAAFILGSIFGERTGNTANFFNSSRRVFGSKITGVNNSYFDDVPKWQYSRYFDFTNQRQIAGSIVGQVIFDSNIIFDSVAPDMIQIAALSGDSIATGSVVNFVSDPDFPNLPGGTGTTIASIVILSDSAWINSYPFQTRYKNLTRNLVFNRTLQVPTGSANIFGQVKIKNPSGENFILVDVTSSQPQTDFDISNIGLYYDDTTAHGGFLLLPIDIIKKSFFGCGDGLRLLPGTTELQNAKYRTMPEYYMRSFPDPNYLAAPIIRGFKYGLQNANITRDKIIFRRTKYGQLRDLLEQRKYTAVLKENGIDRPILVRFVSGTLSHQRSQIYATASAPTSFNANDSGIYDQFSRSGKPFDDTM